MFSCCSRQQIPPLVKPQHMISYSRKSDKDGRIYSGVEFGPAAQAAYGFITQTNIFNPKLELAEIISQVFSEFSEQVQLSTGETWLSPTQLGTDDAVILNQYFMDKISPVFRDYTPIELANICFLSRKSASNPTYDLYCFINTLIITAAYRCFDESALIDSSQPTQPLEEAKKHKPLTIEPCLDGRGHIAFKQTLTMQCTRILPPGHAGAGIGVLNYPALIIKIAVIIPLYPLTARNPGYIEPCYLNISVREGLEPLLELIKNRITKGAIISNTMEMYRHYWDETVAKARAFLA